MALTPSGHAAAPSQEGVAGSGHAESFRVPAFVVNQGSLP
jgi:hypothetical protein